MVKFWENLQLCTVAARSASRRQGVGVTWAPPPRQHAVRPVPWAPGGDWWLRLALPATWSTFSFPHSSLKCPELRALGQPGCLFSSY